MDVRIGVKNAKELDVELGDDVKQADVVKQIEAALAKEDHVLWMTDKKGKMIGVPSKKIAYVEIGSSDKDRKVGFAS